MFSRLSHLNFTSVSSESTHCTSDLQYELIFAEIIILPASAQREQFSVWVQAKYVFDLSLIDQQILYWVKLKQSWEI